MWFLVGIVGVLALCCSRSVEAQEQPLLVLPVRFHLARETTQVYQGTKMDVWVTADDVKNTLLPEINRIWKQARIQFVCESVQEEALPASPERQQILEQITAIQRRDPATRSESSLALSKRLFARKKFDPKAINVYFLPYIGNTMQGISAGGGNRLLVGVWSNKSGRGKQPPQKVLLTEPEPMVVGSLGRTLSHELGHTLTLQHPDREAQPGGRLMGGTTQGYLLTPDEITQARESAKRHLSLDPSSP